MLVLAGGSMESPRFVRMIRLVHHFYPWSDKPDSVKLAHSTRVVPPRAFSRGAWKRLPAQLASSIRRALRGLLANQIGKRQRLVGRLRNFEHMINHVLFQSNRLEL